MPGFIKDGLSSYAGRHVLVDLHGCAHNAEMHEIESTLVEACKATGATVLFNYAHPFNGGGSSGAIILAESHCTWHQWPEENFIAIDIFVCGECDPMLAVPFMEELFKPAYSEIKVERRGISEKEHDAL